VIQRQLIKVPSYKNIRLSYYPKEEKLLLVSFESNFGEGYFASFNYSKDNSYKLSKIESLNFFPVILKDAYYSIDEFNFFNQNSRYGYYKIITSEGKKSYVGIIDALKFTVLYNFEQSADIGISDNIFSYGFEETLKFKYILGLTVSSYSFKFEVDFLNCEDKNIQISSKEGNFCGKDNYEIEIGGIKFDSDSLPVFYYKKENKYLLCGNEKFYDLKKCTEKCEGENKAIGGFCLSSYDNSENLIYLRKTEGNNTDNETMIIEEGYEEMLLEDLIDNIRDNIEVQVFDPVEEEEEEIISSFDQVMFVSTYNKTKLNFNIYYGKEQDAEDYIGLVRINGSKENITCYQNEENNKTLKCEYLSGEELNPGNISVKYIWDKEENATVGYFTIEDFPKKPNNTFKEAKYNLNATIPDELFKKVNLMVIKDYVDEETNLLPGIRKLQETPKPIINNTQRIPIMPTYAEKDKNNSLIYFGYKVNIPMECTNHTINATLGYVYDRKEVKIEGTEITIRALKIEGDTMVHVQPAGQKNATTFGFSLNYPPDEALKIYFASYGNPNDRYYPNCTAMTRVYYKCVTGNINMVEGLYIVLGTYNKFDECIYQLGYLNYTQNAMKSIANLHEIDPCKIIDINKDSRFDFTERYLMKKVFGGMNKGAPININKINLPTTYSPNVGSGISLATCTGENTRVIFGKTPMNFIVTENERTRDKFKKPVFKCLKKVKDFKNNIGLWLFMSIFLLFFILLTILTTVRCTDALSWESGCENDLQGYHRVRIAPGSVSSVSADKLAQTPNDKQDPNNDITFIRSLSQNLFILHPLCSFIRNSLFTPCIYNTMILFTNVCGLFGFNAIYFTNDMIEDRIEDKQRDNFIYPMKTEFERIMAAIAFCCGVTLVMRFVNLTTFSTKNYLNENFTNFEDFGPTYEVYYYAMLPRRIIAGLLMLGLNIFMYFYVVVFCGVYINTQFGWFYSGCWALMWDWIIYAPLLIVIISAMEAIGVADAYLHYVKAFFIF
ncbi:MAG: hypothetical protein MJ252_20035, partial [archaeon]|nr:hypothetical protein [archaeon]